MFLSFTRTIYVEIVGCCFGKKTDVALTFGFMCMNSTINLCPTFAQHPKFIRLFGTYNVVHFDLLHFK